MEWGELLENLNVYKLLFSLKRFSSLQKEHLFSYKPRWSVYALASTPEQLTHKLRKRIEIMESFFMSVPGVFSACSCSRRDEGTLPRRSVVTELQAGSTCCLWEGTWEMEIFEVSGQKPTKQEMDRNKVQKVPSGKHFGFPGEKREYNNTARVPNAHLEARA